KEFYGWDYQEDFHVPDEVYKQFASVRDNGEQKEKQWNDLFAEYKKEYPELADQLENAIEGRLPEDWDKDLPAYQADEDKLATRAALSEVINAISQRLPQLFGGSADLASSTKTLMKNVGNFDANHYGERNVWFGVREFAMAAASNGIALHGGL